MRNILLRWVKVGTTENRMDKIAKSLTPKQAVIASMEEAHRFESLSEYALVTVERPEEVTDFAALIEQVEFGVRDRMKGETAKKVQKTVRDAVGETAFLYHLHLKVNGHFGYEARSMGLMGLLLLERDCAAMQEPTGTRLYLDRYDAKHINLPYYAKEVFTLKAAVEQVAKRYFDNHQVLWKSFAEQLENFIQIINQTVANRKDAFYFADWSRHSGETRHLGDRDKKRPNLNFDLEALKQSIDPKEIVKSVVYRAHAEMLSLMGDHQAAAERVASLFRTVE